jgi:hypothetical protein
MHPHFLKEDQYALPPLGLLPMLAAGRITPDMAAVLPLTEKLAGDLGEMLDEHRSIVTALNVLVETAKRENKPEYVEFADKLRQHAQLEEQVTYPTALLVGAYIKAMLNK